ncbi:MAG: hypothetical protein CBD27_07465 [Rhodospirillaceae bacterium TMED167]|nr:hypothetical protein [Rhodospirillaceae bacterium]OUW26850.1 MAG: hypothetical protein CBD27_07465 [Rhodospirillaceae bacterium TMED167]
MRKRNTISGIFLLALTIGYGVMTANLPTRAIEDSTQPSFFPWVVTVCLLILSLLLLLQGVLPIASIQAPAPINVKKWKIFSALISVIVYLVALPQLGFVVANIVLFGALMLLYGERRPVPLISGSILVPIAIFLIFRDLFQIRLPSGILGGII